MDIASLFGLGVLGTVVGSYVGALTWRLPRGISIAKGRSFCDFCRKKIIWSDNIPIVSYFILGGRCRSCGKKISLRYPAIEFSTALGFIGIGYLVTCCATSLQGSTFKVEFLLPFLLFIFSYLVAIFVIDIEHQIIPDQLIFSLLAVTLSLLIISSASDFYIRIASGFGAAVFLLLVHLVTRGRGMGLGDVKFALFAGTFLSFPNTLVWLFVSFLTGAGVGIILILGKKAKFGKPIAFGPFLAVGVIITLIFGNYLVKRWL